MLEARVVTRHGRVNDEALKKLIPLSKLLVRLDIRDTAVTDDVCGTLSKFNSLVELNLRGCKVGDKGVAQLMGLKTCSRSTWERLKLPRMGLVNCSNFPILPPSIFGSPKRDKSCQVRPVSYGSADY